ncbi:unnamed protein product [Saccharopolyspora erythraea NRRL 2338]|uniref:Saccharopolyspora erythraea NRRL2338 complete genome n=1 Tax=Saccharopolyspora erythraea (strain ATCC 11635 / DSM 40517 / JCM 4748 / NBRC 13426 / NCIMB 8594 / NRRL 2338) TaxID=405948 RepID=A4F6B8_SACEN|nr:unnamed protein product [Saccharopolyspora erythraea NRRL 2338]
MTTAAMSPSRPTPRVGGGAVPAVPAVPPQVSAGRQHALGRHEPSHSCKPSQPDQHRDAWDGWDGYPPHPVLPDRGWPVNGPVSPAGASEYPLAIHLPGPLGATCANASPVGKWMPGGSGVDAPIQGGFPPTRPPTHSTTRHQPQPRPGGWVDLVDTPRGDAPARLCRGGPHRPPTRSNRPPSTTPGDPR